MGYPRPLKMTFGAWIDYQLDPRELILNASAVDGSDFHQHHPIGISVFAIPALPVDMKQCVFRATQANLCSAMFQPGTKQRPQQHRVDRRWEIQKKPWITPVYCSVLEHRIDASIYMQQLLQDKFTCSPRGHGVDCHRNYEAILCKCIPLITGHDDSMTNWKYPTLPVLFMDDYTQLTPEWLEQQYERILNTEYEFHWLTRSFWYWRRPDVNIDMQSEKWMRKFDRWNKWKQYVTCKPDPL